MDKVSSKKMQAALELGSAGAIWGFGFVVTIWILPFIGPLWISVLRFGLSAALVATAALLVPKLRARFTLDDARNAVLPGFALAAMMVLQTWGLRFTSATSSGFITTLYVVLVPMLQAIFFGKRIGMGTFLLILLALVGTALIAKLHLGAFNLGDLLTLGCALVAAIHILVIDRFAAKARSPLSLNTFQSLWGALLCLPFAVAFESFPSLSSPAIAWAGVAYLTVISTMIAFLIQIRAQRLLAPVTASLLFLLESPFSAVFARYFLGDQLLPSQWFGGGLILVSATLCIVRPEARDTTA
jgi:drug/metabolite transporter (DMT)-like permease